MCNKVYLMTTLILFDVDGTLTVPRKKIEKPMDNYHNFNLITIY